MASNEDIEDDFESTAVGAVTPPLDPAREIPGRERDKSPFAASRLSGALALSLAGVFGGTLLAAAAVLLVVVLPANSAHEERLAAARADLAAAQIEGIAASLRDAAAHLAELPETARALRSRDADALSELEARFGAAVDDALRVRIHALGTAEDRLTEVPPLTFAGLDLIRNAENGEPGGPEHTMTAAGPLVNVAAAVPGAGPRPEGTVMITYAATALTDPLQALPADAGRFTLLQTFGNNPAVEITALGTGGGGAVLERKLSVRNWTLRYEAPTPTPVASALLTIPAWVLVLALAAGLVVVAQRRVARFVRADLERIVDAANAMALGRDPGVPRDYALDEFAAAGAVLRDLSRDIEPGGRKKAAPAKIAVNRPAADGAEPEPAVEVEEIDDAFLEIEENDAATEDTEIPDVLEDFEDDAASDGDLVVDAADLPPDVIFRDYDIRGVVGEQLSEAHARLIGRAIGSAVSEAGESAMAVAGDCRHSTAALKAALVEGITAAGVDVVDLGDVPTPILYHTTHTTALRSGVIVTGSHNAPDYNGFKIVIGGETLASGRIAALAERIRDGRFTSGSGSVTTEDGVSRYVDEISTDIALAQPLKVVVDCGNGIAGGVAPRLLEALGCEVLPLYCDADGDFPNHHPDPADPANLEDLSTVVRAEGADIGIALDGDGDRIGAVDEKGNIIWPDRLMMLFARDIVGRNPGADVIFDVKCSRHLNSLIAEYGGRPIMWKTGHAHLKAKMRETGALLGGELSGHIGFGERWHGFDDGLYSAARLLEIVAGEAVEVSAIFGEFPAAVSTPEIRVPIAESKKFDTVAQLIESGVLDQGDVTTIDGLRVDYPDGWGLVRASNTAPELTLRFEADTAGAVHEIVDQFKSALRELEPSLDFTIDV